MMFLRYNNGCKWEDAIRSEGIWWQMQLWWISDEINGMDENWQFWVRNKSRTRLLKYIVGWQNAETHTDSGLICETGRGVCETNLAR